MISLGENTLKEVIRPFSISKDEDDATDILKAVIAELQRREPDVDADMPLSESYLEGFFDLTEILVLCGLVEPVNEEPQHDEDGDVIGGGQFACDEMLLHCCKIDQLSMIHALLQMGANPNAAIALGGGQTPLFYSALRGNLDACRMLIEAGADIDKPKSDGSTPLNIAAEKDHLEVCMLLVEEGANCKLSTKDKWNPFSNAVHNGSLAITKLLLDSAGADVNCVLGNGYTPLTVSAVQGDLEVFKLLLARGANPLVTTRDGKSIQDMATRNERFNILDHLGSSDYKSIIKKWKSEKKKKREEREMDLLSPASKKRRLTELALKKKKKKKAAAAVVLDDGDDDNVEEEPGSGGEDGDIAENDQSNSIVEEEEES